MEPGGPLALQSGDILLLASDGLWGPFTDKELVESFSSRQVPAALDDLITRALERESGRSDNITGAVMRWGRGEIAHDTAKPVCRILAIS